MGWYVRSLGSPLLAGMTQDTGTLAEILGAVASLHGSLWPRTKAHDDATAGYLLFD